MIDGTLPTTIKAILDEAKPESAYFTEENGHRTGFIVVNMKDESSIPALAEPWFLAFNARVEFHPTMVVEDLMKAWPAIEAAVRNHAKKPMAAAR
jgi:hypothetical protein